MDRQCSSCGGFCRKSGCERENVEPTPDPIYTAPPQRDDTPANAVKWQLLTNTEIEDAYMSGTGFVLARENNVQQHLSRHDNICFARAIEAKLKEKNT